MRSGSNDRRFNSLFRENILAARKTRQDIDQYFTLLSDLYEKGFLKDAKLPADIETAPFEDRILWLSANVNIRFDQLFSYLSPLGR